MPDNTNQLYDVTYSSFSGCDIVASITIPLFNTRPLVIGELQTISYSIHREVVPVRTLGRANPKGFTSGTRTVAGSLIFTVFDSNLVHRIVKAIKSSYESSITQTDNSNLLYNKYEDRISDIDSYSVMDEMPPFDITVSFGNEYGNNSMLVIKGIVIVDEGQVMSIEDMITENTMSYMATDIQVLKSVESANTLRTPLLNEKNDTLLSSLIVNGLRMYPSFDPAVTSYVVILPEGTSTAPTVRGVPRSKDSTLVTFAALGIPGATQLLVTGKDQTLTRYKVRFLTAKQNTYLSSISVDGIPIEGFDKNIGNYIVTLSSGAKAMPRIEGQSEDTSAKVIVNRAFGVPPGITYIVVMAEDTVTTRTYSVSFVF